MKFARQELQTWCDQINHAASYQMQSLHYCSSFSRIWFLLSWPPAAASQASTRWWLYANPAHCACPILHHIPKGLLTSIGLPEPVKHFCSALSVGHSGVLFICDVSGITTYTAASILLLIIIISYSKKKRLWQPIMNTNRSHSFVIPSDEPWMSWRHPSRRLDRFIPSAYPAAALMMQSLRVFFSFSSTMMMGGNMLLLHKRDYTYVSLSFS